MVLVQKSFTSSHYLFLFSRSYCARTIPTPPRCRRRGGWHPNEPVGLCPGHLARAAAVRCATRPRSKTSGPGGRAGGRAETHAFYTATRRSSESRACGFKNVQRRRRRHHLNGPNHRHGSGGTSDAPPHPFPRRPMGDDDDILQRTDIPRIKSFSTRPRRSGERWTH